MLVEREHRFQVGELHVGREITDFEIQESNVSVRTLRDEMRQSAIHQFKLDIAENVLTRDVHFDRSVDASFEVYATWFDHFLASHPRLAWILRRKPRMSRIGRWIKVQETRHVDLRAMVPELQIPHNARKGFTVYYTTTERK